MTDAARLMRLIGRSFADPRGTAQMLNAVRFNRGVLWSLLLLVICLSVLALVMSMWAFPSAVQNPVLLLSPFGLAAILGLILVVMVFALYFTGQMLGGQGRFPGMLLMLTWWQGMAVVLQVCQVVVLLAIPVLGAIVSLAGFVWLIVALVVAVTVAHQFDSAFKGFGTVVLALLGTMFGLALILTLIGVGVQGMSNV